MGPRESANRTVPPGSLKGDGPAKGPEFTWTVHLAKKDPRKAVVVGLFAVFAGLFGVALVGSVWMFPLGVLIILLGTADFLLPVNFRISGDGASRRCGLGVTSIRWSDVRRVVEGPDGVKLSPLERRTRTAPFRGVFLREDGNLQEIRAAVEYWRKHHAPDVGEPAHGRGQAEVD